MGTLRTIAPRVAALLPCGTMWHALTNWIRSFATYGDLSPDFALRYRLNRHLRQHRPELPPDPWGQGLSSTLPEPLSPALVQFAYQSLERYSGLAIGCTRSSDRLIEDLHLPLVCWFDWPHRLCQDFSQTFHIEMGEDFDETYFATLGELIAFLQKQLTPHESPLAWVRDPDVTES